MWLGGRGQENAAGVGLVTGAGVGDVAGLGLTGVLLLRHAGIPKPMRAAHDEARAMRRPIIQPPSDAGPTPAREYEHPVPGLVRGATIEGHGRPCKSLKRSLITLTERSFSPQRRRRVTKSRRAVARRGFSQRRSSPGRKQTASPVRRRWRSGPRTSATGPLRTNATAPPACGTPGLRSSP